MYKKISKIQFILLLVLSFSCVQDGTYELPDTSISEPTISANSSILKIKTALQQNFNSNASVVYQFPDNPMSPTYIEGFVVSTDATGNFYKKIILQDNPNNPTAGIEILINKAAIHTSYEIGQKLYIKLDGLAVGYADGGNLIDPTNLTLGTYTLGFMVKNEVRHIPFTILKNHIFKSSIVSKIHPTIVTLSAIKENHLNTFIRLEDAQFDKSQLEKSFAGEPYDEYDGFRMLTDCSSTKNIPLQTSTFASFKSVILPNNRGSIDAVLCKDYTASFLVAIINSPAALSFSNLYRCDPVFLDCGALNGGTATNLFQEGFETIKNQTSLTTAGWKNINMNGKNTLFLSRTSKGNRFLEISAYNSGESPLEVWLISPKIQLDNTTAEKLSFETNTGYDNGKVVTVYGSTDYSGSIQTATWIPLDVILSEGPSSGYGAYFTPSGIVNIGCLTGSFHLAFKYSGADGGVTTTFRLDNIKITAN